jgi:hypothetical protein
LGIFDKITGRHKRPDQPEGETDHNAIIARERVPLLTLLVYLRVDSTRDAALEYLGVSLALPPHVFHFLDQQALIAFPGGRVLDIPVHETTLFITAQTKDRSHILFLMLYGYESQLRFELKGKGVDPARAEPALRRQLCANLIAAVQEIRPAVNRITQSGMP